MSASVLPPDAPHTLEQERTALQPLIIGALISFTLFGIGLFQFFLCFGKQRRESTLDKVLFNFLVLLCIADIVDSVGKAWFITDHARIFTTTSWSTPLIMPRSTIYLIVSEAFITCQSHALYIYRIIKLTPERGVVTWIVLLFAVSLSLGQFVGAMACTLWIPKPVAEWLATGLLPWASLWLGASAAADALLCILFCLCLYSQKKKTDFASTRLMISRWISLTLETGLAPSILQFTTILIFIAYPNKPFDVMFSLIQPKVYVISTLVVVHHIIAGRSNPSGPVVTGTFWKESMLVEAQPGAMARFASHARSSFASSNSRSSSSKRGLRSPIRKQFPPRREEPCMTEKGTGGGIFVTVQVQEWEEDRRPEHLALRIEEEDFGLKEVSSEGSPDSLRSASLRSGYLDEFDAAPEPRWRSASERRKPPPFGPKPTSPGLRPPSFEAWGAHRRERERDDDDTLIPNL